MKTDQGRIDRIEKALVKAHSHRPDYKLPAHCRYDIMRDIRNLAATESGEEANGVSVFAGLLFRFAGTTSIVAAILIFYVFFYVSQVSPNYDLETAKLLINDPIVFLELENIL